MRLIVGLGNPGKLYRGTWHNLGAATVERLATRWGVMFQPGRGDFIYADSIRKRRKVTLLIPTSYMNRSGGPVAMWLRYHRVTPEQMLIVFDDHDMPLGRIRIRANGSSGGHQGMEDIIRLVGSDDIPRLKIGIRTDAEKDELAHQVLSRIPKRQENRVDKILDIASDAVETIINEGMISAMNAFNKYEID